MLELYTGSVYWQFHLSYPFLNVYPIHFMLQILVILIKTVVTAQNVKGDLKIAANIDIVS